MKGAILADQLNFAVFIDYDNVAIGVKNTLDRSFDYKHVAVWLESQGAVSSQVAYGNWNTHQDFGLISRALARHGVRMQHLDPSSASSKNGADIALSIDALELVFTQEHINAFCILSGDSDFLPLVHKLKTYNKRVYIMAGTAFMSETLRRNCHKFISYEQLCGQAEVRQLPNREPPASTDGPQLAPLEDAAELVRRTIREMRSRGETPYTRQIRTALLQLEPDFDERRYGFDSFKELIIQLVNDRFFRRQPLGEGRFCIAENHGGGSELYDRLAPRRTEDALRYGPRQEVGRRLRDRRGARGAREREPRDEDRAAAAIRDALAQIAARGQVAELELLYRTITDADPGFPAYGCEGPDFRHLISKLVGRGLFSLKMAGGVWVVEDLGGRPRKEVPEAPSPRSANLLHDFVMANASLLQEGVPAKQVEAMLLTRLESAGEEAAAGEVGALMAHAVREGLLSSEPGVGGTVRYRAPPGRENQPPQTDFRGSHASHQRERTDSPPRGQERTRAAGLAVLARALRVKEELFEQGLPRSELRAALSDACPDFDGKDYGFRSFRELLDLACAEGYLESWDDGAAGLRYVGTARLSESEPPVSDAGGTAALSSAETAPGAEVLEPDGKSERRVAYGDHREGGARQEDRPGPEVPGDRPTDATSAGLASPKSEALEIVLAAVDSHETASEGLDRTDLRLALRKFRPNFDFRAYGFSGLRELLDYACADGALETREDAAGRIRYFAVAQSAEPVSEALESDGEEPQPTQPAAAEPEQSRAEQPKLTRDLGADEPSSFLKRLFRRLGKREAAPPA